MKQQALYAKFLRKAGRQAATEARRRVETAASTVADRTHLTPARLSLRDRVANGGEAFAAASSFNPTAATATNTREVFFRQPLGPRLPHYPQIEAWTLPVDVGSSSDTLETPANDPHNAAAASLGFVHHGLRSGASFDGAVAASLRSALQVCAEVDDLLEASSPTASRGRGVAEGDHNANHELVLTTAHHVALRAEQRQRRAEHLVGAIDHQFGVESYGGDDGDANDSGVDKRQGAAGTSSGDGRDDGVGS